MNEAIHTVMESAVPFGTVYSTVYLFTADKVRGRNERYKMTQCR